MSIFPSKTRAYKSAVSPDQFQRKSSLLTGGFLRPRKSGPTQLPRGREAAAAGGGYPQSAARAASELVVRYKKKPAPDHTATCELQIGHTGVKRRHDRILESSALWGDSCRTRVTRTRRAHDEGPRSQTGTPRALTGAGRAVPAAPTSPQQSGAGARLRLDSINAPRETFGPFSQISYAFRRYRTRNSASHEPEKYLLKHNISLCVMRKLKSSRSAREKNEKNYQLQLHKYTHLINPCKPRE
ncbi:unnamed protein product [Nesidiocoris tenuis]|uniref:Uncharacterized protein n=1 Tax=Nesidiocoris tenuis TaxID=355587 RepID=A0A6H5GJ70_9HEMI|nr:unnamed protein product [Nesidiocoris tenuis]